MAGRHGETAATGTGIENVNRTETKQMNNPPSRSAARAPGLVGTGLIVALALAGCDLSVTNPGPVQDEFLDDPDAAEAVVNGMEFQLSNAMGWIAYTGGVAAHEIVPSGHNTNTFGVRDEAREGRLVPDENSPHWEQAHEARWMAEDGVRRFREVLGEAEFAGFELGARALLYAGFANRLLGESMCVAVFDGGPEESHLRHFERAEDDFTEALEIARAVGNETYEHAALAGRASVRIWLDDWSGAVSDAGEVPDDFEFVTRFNDGAVDQYNRLFWAQADNPNRAFSVYSTFYEDYYRDTGDPRTPWRTDPDNEFGTVGEVPFYVQEKYPERTSPMVLASGAEMRLLEAEDLLRGGDWEAAAAIIDDRREEIGVPRWDPADEEEAWTALKRERGIELWLEARRLPDRRRWLESGTPGEAEDMTGRDTCFPVGLSEMETNPNIELDP